MMSEHLNLDDLAGLVKGVEEGLQGEAEIEPKDKKIRKILENLSTGIHQLYSAIGKKQDDEHVQALTDQVSSIVQSEGIHAKGQMQVIQDAEVLQPAKSHEEMVEFSRNEGKKGAEYGRLGGRPEGGISRALSPQEQIVHHQ